MKECSVSNSSESTIRKLYKGLNNLTSAYVFTVQCDIITSIRSFPKQRFHPKERREETQDSICRKGSRDWLRSHIPEFITVFAGKHLFVLLWFCIQKRVGFSLSNSLRSQFPEWLYWEPGRVVQPFLKETAKAIRPAQLLDKDPAILSHMIAAMTYLFFISTCCICG